MSEKLQFTISQGNTILRECFTMPIPEKIEGIGAWNRQMRGTVGDNIRALKKALCAVSPLFKRTKRIHFGPEEAYDEVDAAGDMKSKDRQANELGEVVTKNYVLRDDWRHRTVEVELNSHAWKGLYVILLLLVHPGPLHLNGKEFDLMLSPGFQDEVIWPLAEQMGVDQDIAKKTGRGQSAGLEIKTNEEYAAEVEKVKEAGNAKAEEP